jgi:hypothetical protein
MSYRDPKTYTIDGQTVVLTPNFVWENDEDQLVSFTVRVDRVHQGGMEAEGDFPTPLQVRRWLSTRKKPKAQWLPAHQHAYEVEQLEAEVAGLKAWHARSVATAKRLRAAIPTAVEVATRAADEADRTVEVMRKQVEEAEKKLAEKLASPAQ